MSDYLQALDLITTVAENYGPLSAEERALADTLLRDYGFAVFTTFITARKRGDETDEERIYQRFGTTRGTVDNLLK